MNYQLLQSDFLNTSNLSPIEQVFANRGMRPSEIEHYLHTSEDDLLNPSLLTNIDRGAKMFIEHLAKGHKIFVQVDSDMDGFTSAAALINYAYKIAPGTT